MDTIGPEKALRWLKDDFAPPVPARAAVKLVVVEEKEAAVERRNDASTPPALLVRACLLGFLSMSCKRT